MLVQSVKLLILFNITCLVFSTNYNNFDNCQNNNGTVIDNDLCTPNDYKKATVPWNNVSSPFKMNVSIMLISLVKVSIQSSSFSFYFSTYWYWRDPRYSIITI